MKPSEKCSECLGHGEILCPVCRGTRKDPRNPSQQCSHCKGAGHRKCDVCNGSGKSFFAK